MQVCREQEGVVEVGAAGAGGVAGLAVRSQCWGWHMAGSQGHPDATTAGCLPGWLAGWLCGFRPRLLTANLYRRLQLQQVWLAHEDLLGRQAQLPDLQQ